ncbi:hypothetical protein FR819_09230 [Leclercia adecarboxylata]|nr:hypothetical protein FR819_09230 [Leclercia adecarboxylata]
MRILPGRHGCRILPAIILSLPFVISVTMAQARASSSPSHSISDNTSPGGLFAALRSTMLHHPGLASQQALVRSKEANADSARAARLPTLGASAGTGQISGYNDSTSTTLSVSQLYGLLGVSTARLTTPTMTPLLNKPRPGLHVVNCWKRPQWPTRMCRGVASALPLLNRT